MTIGISLDIFTTPFLVSPPSVSAEIDVPAAAAQIDPYVGTTISGTCSVSASSVEVFLDVVGGTSLGTAVPVAGAWSMADKLKDFAQAGAHTLIAVADGVVSNPSPPVSITILSVKESLALVPGLIRAQWVPLVANTDYRVDTGNLEGGTRVDRWFSSTNGAHVASQDTDADQPGLVTVSGGPMLEFASGDGNGDAMTLDAAWLSGLANFDLFLAYKRTAQSVTDDILSCDGSELLIRLTSGQHMQVFMPSGSASGRTNGVGADSAGPHVARIRWDGAGAANIDKLKIEIDGVDQTLVFSGTLSQSAGHTAMAIGRQTTGTNPAGISYALIWAFNTNLSAPQLAKVEALIDYLVPWATFA